MSKLRAKEVGASTTRMVRCVDDPLASNKITETEIVQNIEVALQTATMIDMCKTSAKNYKIAIVSAIAAALSAWVALIAILSK